jgi:hypothetical protein
VRHRRILHLFVIGRFDRVSTSKVTLVFGSICDRQIDRVSRSKVTLVFGCVKGGRYLVEVWYYLFRHKCLFLADFGRIIVREGDLTKAR